MRIEGSPTMALLASIGALGIIAIKLFPFMLAYGIVRYVTSGTISKEEIFILYLSATILIGAIPPKPRNVVYVEKKQE